MKFTFPPESRPLPGYTIKRAIDRGGFGEVYYALSDAGKEVALKLLQHNLDVELRGVRQCLNLRHPNLVTIFDIRTDDDEDHWIVMEYAGGRTLEQTLAAARQSLSPADALAWMRGIADGVEFLHARGLVHRDLKPGNIFADQGTVKVGDVGLSKFITPSRRSAQTESVGTVHYMAPEVARGRYGKEVDVYAAGVILYEILAGKVPFDGESTAEILMKHLTATPDLSPIPSDLRPLLTRALEKDPERRLESIGDLATGLEQFVAGKQPTVPEARRETIQESIERNRTTAPPNQYRQPAPEPVAASASNSFEGDELDSFWRYVSHFFRPERNFFRSVGRDLYRFWKQDVPFWIRWPVIVVILCLSPVWFLVLLASTPWMLFITFVYFGIREAIRVAIWMADPPPNTHPWTRLLGGRPSSVPTPDNVQPARFQSPVSSQASPEIPSQSYSPQQPQAPLPAYTQSPYPDAPPQSSRPNLGFFERWSGIPLLGLAGFVSLLMIDALSEKEFIFLHLLVAIGLFLFSRSLASKVLNRHAVSYHNRRGINFLFLSLATFTSVLGFAGLEYLNSSNLNDDGEVALLCSIIGFALSTFLIGRRFGMNPNPQQPAFVDQPVSSSIPRQSSRPFGFLDFMGWGLATILVILVALSVGSIFFGIAAPSANRIVLPGIQVASIGRFSVIAILVPVALAAFSFFLLRWIRFDQSPAPGDASQPAVPVSTPSRNHRSSEFWLVAGFLALWLSLALGWWKGVAPNAFDGSWASYFFFPDSWTGIALIVWGEILLFAILIGKLVPQIPLQTSADVEPRLAHLRLTTGFLQSLLWSLLLSAGFTATILAISDNAGLYWVNGRPWDSNAESYPRFIWMFSFLAISSTILLTQSFLRNRFGFLKSSRFFTLLVSGLLLAAVVTWMDYALGQFLPLGRAGASNAWPERFVTSLQFFLPIAICGGWLGQIDPVRPRRFRFSRMIWVIIVSAAVGGILELDRHPDTLELWIFLMAGLSGVIQLSALWTDPEGLLHRSTSQPDRHYYNVSLVQGA